MPLEKVSTGIDELDRMLLGGIPKGHAVLVVGSPGTGKTVFACQFLWTGLQHKENCLLLSLEELSHEIIATAKGFGWDFEKYLFSLRDVDLKEPLEKRLEKRKKPILYLGVWDPEELKDVTKLKKTLDALDSVILATKCTRIVIDPFSTFIQLLGAPAEQRSYIIRLKKHLKSVNATAVYTAESRIDMPTASRDEQVMYAVDAIIALWPVMTPQKISYNMAIVKVRQSGHSHEIRPYKITNKGIEVGSASSTKDRKEHGDTQS